MSGPEHKHGICVVPRSSLIELSLLPFRPVYGLIFLFKWQKDESGSSRPVVEDLPNVFFAKQVLAVRSLASCKKAEPPLRSCIPTS